MNQKQRKGVFLLRGDDLLKYNRKEYFNLNTLSRSEYQKRKAPEESTIAAKQKKNYDGEKEK